MNNMEGPYITREVKNDGSEYTSSPDAGFNETLERAAGDKHTAWIAHELSELERRPARKKILQEALIEDGKNWRDLRNIGKESEAGLSLAHLLAFWETLSEDERKKEASEFAKKL